MLMIVCLMCVYFSLVIFFSSLLIDRVTVLQKQQANSAFGMVIFFLLNFISLLFSIPMGCEQSTQYIEKRWVWKKIGNIWKKQRMWKTLKKSTIFFCFKTEKKGLALIAI